MPENWYYARKKQRIGPFTFAQVRQMAAAGLLMPADMLWNEGASCWVSASDVPGLFAATAPVFSALMTSPHPEPLPPATPTEPSSEASSGRDLAKCGLLSRDDVAVSDPFPADRGRPADGQRWEDFGESLVTAPAPSSTDSAPLANPRAEDQSRRIPGKEETLEPRRGRPPSSPRRPLDSMLTITVALALLAFIGAAVLIVCSLYLEGPFVILSGLLLILSGPLFLIAGVPIIVTGHVPYSKWLFSRRPRYARLEGVAAMLIGIGAAAGGWEVFVTSLQRDSKPSAPPLSTNRRPVNEPTALRSLPAKQFHKDEKSVLQYQGKEASFALWLVPETWTRLEKVENPAVETGFTHKDGKALALVFAGRTPIPKNALRKAVIDKWRHLDKDAKLIHEEARVVNGTEILCLTMNVCAKGVSATYHGYYYTGDQGTIEIITSTEESLFQELQPELERFLNGFEIIKQVP